MHKIIKKTPLFTIPYHALKRRFAFFFFAFHFSGKKFVPPPPHFSVPSYATVVGQIISECCVGLLPACCACPLIRGLLCVVSGAKSAILMLLKSGGISPEYPNSLMHWVTLLLLDIVIALIYLCGKLHNTIPYNCTVFLRRFNDTMHCKCWRTIYRS